MFLTVVLFLSLCLYSNAGKVSMTLWNNDLEGRDVNVFWVNNDKHAEVLISTISYGSTRSIDTNTEHLFVFRANSDGSHIRHFVVPEPCPELKPEDPVVFQIGGGHCDHPKLFVGIVPYAQEIFMQKYKERTGRPWINVYPRPVPVHFMYPISDIGTKFKTTTRYGYFEFVCDEPNCWENRSMHEFSAPGRERDSEPLDLEIQVVSKEPFIMTIDNFLSEDECDFIKSFTEERGGFAPSTTGKSSRSSIRTSHTHWIQYDEHSIVDLITRRIFDVMHMEYNPMEHWKMIEKLQVLKYSIGEEYKAHHDYSEAGESDKQKFIGIQRGENRLTTFFMYLSDVQKGGETAFPMAQHLAPEGEETRKSKQFVSKKSICSEKTTLKISPKKGKIVFWYSLLHDGNLDDYSVHAACPVEEGLKHACNFWIWDPINSAK